MHITVAICTWNRANLLDQTLTHMRNLRIPTGLSWELLVVNNNCTDHTDEVLARHAAHLPLRSVVEPQQGHSHSRNRALDMASGEWLIFTDDDVLVDTDWLVAYDAVMKTLEPKVAFLGGEIRPWFPVPPDPALAEAVSMVRDGFCARTFPANPHIRSKYDYMPFGANFALRLSASQHLRFDPALGLVGNRRIIGEEVVFMMALMDQGFEGLWAPNASLQHYVDPERLTIPRLRRALNDSGRTVARRGRALDGRLRILGVPLWAYRAIIAGAFHLALPITWITNRVRYFSAFRDYWYYTGYVGEYVWGIRDATNTNARP